MILRLLSTVQAELPHSMIYQLVTFMQITSQWQQNWENLLLVIQLKDMTIHSSQPWILVIMLYWKNLIWEIVELWAVHLISHHVRIFLNCMPKEHPFQVLLLLQTVKFVSLICQIQLIHLLCVTLMIWMTFLQLLVVWNLWLYRVEKLTVTNWFRRSLIHYRYCIYMM